MNTDLTPATTADTTPDVLGLGTYQAALFDDPAQLLALDAAKLRRLGADLAHQVKPGLAEVRRVVGLVCWAMKSKVPHGEYGTWVEGYSALIGIPVRTLGDWRAKAESGSGVPNPYTAPRPPKAAGQSRRLASPANLIAPIPAASKEARSSTPKSTTADAAATSSPAPATAPTATVIPSGASDADPTSTTESFGQSGTAPTSPRTEPTARSKSDPAPAKSSEGARVTPPRTGKGASIAPSLAPSDPSSEQLRSGPGGVVAPAGVTPPEPPILSINGEVPEPLLVSDADGLRWLRSKSEAAIRSMGDPWRPAIQSEIDRWALAMGIMRPKEPTVKRIVGRKLVEAPVPPRSKRPHDPTCSCLGCKPAKVAK